MRERESGAATDDTGGTAVDVCDGIAIADRSTTEESTATVVHAVVASVGSVSGTDPLELPPLYDVIDPEALRSICSRERGDGTEPTVTVSFEYAGHHVKVTNAGIATATRLE